MKRYRVESGITIRHNGMVWGAGDIVTDADLPADRLESIVDFGALVALEADEDAAPRRRNERR